MKLFGEMSSFAIGFELRPDPDDSGAIENRVSWGGLEIWVANRCLSKGIAADADRSLLPDIEIPLYPVLEWFIESWDVLFHEERLPFKPRGSSTSMDWYLKCVHDTDHDQTFLSLLEARMQWWKRHALASAVPGFRIPDIHFRRYGQKVEISWSDDEWRGYGAGVKMLEMPGAALLGLDVVTSALVEWCGALLTELEEMDVVESKCKCLRNKIGDLNSPTRQIDRLSIVAKEWIVGTADAMRARAGVTAGDRGDTVRALLGVRESQPRADGYYEIFPVPVLLYRSAEPNLSNNDVQQLLDLCVGHGGDCPVRLSEFQESANPPSSPQRITNDGYERALDFRAAYGVPQEAPLVDGFDLERKVLPELGVRIVDLLLEDRGTDGASVYGEGIQATIAINRNGKFSRTRWGRRMTLAHELCHLLYDVEFGRVGIVSGSWAPSSLERRANAFAAMLLAPKPVLKATLPPDPDLWTVGDLRQAMTSMGVGVQTLTWQLYNLGWISASERAAWVEDLVR